MPNAIYPLSADPITNGHLDVIFRARKIFDNLIVAVGNNYAKNYTFSLLERKEMVKRVLKNFSNIRVIGFEGLLTDLAKQENINFIVRGFRNSNDYLHELNLYQNYLSQNPDLEFINLFSSNNFISSTAVKEMIIAGGEIHQSVGILVKSALEKKLKKQVLIGISGGVGAGKSTVARILVQELQAKNIPAQSIDLDILGHEVLEAKTPIELEVKQKILAKFGSSILDNNQNIDRSKLAQKSFSDKQNLKFLTDLIHPLVLLKLRQKLQNKTGVIFVESGIWEEYELSYICNHTMILLESSPQKVSQRLLKKGLGLADIEQRLVNQLDYNGKKSTLQNLIQKDDYGTIWDLKTDQIDQQEIQNLIQKIIQYTQNYV
jgi:pantetheine-phosphate adenylyltransferase